MCATMKIERKDVCYDEDENDDKHIDYIDVIVLSRKNYQTSSKWKVSQLLGVTLFLFLNIYEKQTLKCNVPIFFESKAVV